MCIVALAATAMAKAFIRAQCIYTNGGIIIKLIRAKCILLHFPREKGQRNASKRRELETALPVGTNCCCKAIS